MKKISFLLVVAILIGLASCSKMNKAKLANEKDSVLYMIGILEARNLKKNLEAAEFGKVNQKAIERGFQEEFRGDSIKLTEEQIQAKIQAYLMKLQTEAGEKAGKESKEYLEKNKKAPGVMVTPSGLQYQELKAGNGPVPDSSDMVKVNFKLSYVSGKVIQEQQGIDMPVSGNMIAGWTEALLKMKTGAKWRVVIPSELAWGEQGFQGIKPNSAVVFEIELLQILPKKQDAAKK